MGMDVIMSPVDGIAMQFAKHLRERIRRGRIRCSVRIWTRPHVKVGGRYRMDDGHVVVDTIQPIALADVTYDGFHQLNLPHSPVVILRSFA
jgi:hypothetical protein